MSTDVHVGLCLTVARTTELKFTLCHDMLRSVACIMGLNLLIHSLQN